MENKIVLYGERGIVNGILLELYKKDNISKFLNQVKDIYGTPYFNNIEWKEITIFNEISLGQFGDPDLIIRAKDNQRINHLIFIEAKLSSYKKNSINLNDIESLKKANLGSSLTIQLAQKYRFALALKNYTSKASLKGVFKENSDISYWYDNEYYASYKNGRTIKKAPILRLIRDEFINKSNCFYFISLVSDATGIDGSDGHIPLLSPKFYSNNIDFFNSNLNIYTKPDKNCNFGYLTYHDLVEANVLSFDYKTAFGQAWDLTVNDSRMFSKDRVKRNKTTNGLFNIVEKISANIGGFIKSSETTENHPSFSMEDKFGNVIAKIIIGQDSLDDYHIYLGIKNMNESSKRNYLGIKKYSAKQQTFSWYLIDETNPLESVKEIIKDIKG